MELQGEHTELSAAAPTELDIKWPLGLSPLLIWYRTEDQYVNISDLFQVADLNRIGASSRIYVGLH